MSRFFNFSRIRRYFFLILRLLAPRQVTNFRSFEILETLPHDANAFTQGLVTVKHNNQSLLLEGTGLYGQSELRHVELETGTVLDRHSLSSIYFGEGITNFNYYPLGYNNGEGVMSEQRIIQLTWTRQKAFVYGNIFLDDNDANADPVVLSPPVLEFDFTSTNNEGWGITYRPDKHVFYVSDGSSNLHTWDADTFEEIDRKRVEIRRNNGSGFWGSTVGTAQNNLNELEWDPITKTVLANVWMTDTILRIDPETGYVVTQYDMASLYPNRPVSANVLNGIALTDDFETSREFWVTGKLWPLMFRIKFKD